MALFSQKEDISWQDLLIRSAIVIGTVVIILWCMPRDSRNYLYAEIGKPWKYGDLTAPFDFPVYKSELKVKQERDSIYRLFEPYFSIDLSVENSQVRKFLEQYDNGMPNLPDDYISIIANRLHRLYQQGIISAPDYSQLAYKDTARTIRIVNGKRATSIALKAFYSTKSAYENLINDPMMAPHRVALQRCNLNNFIVPNIIYDKEKSETELEELRRSVPLANGVVQKGQKIIDRGAIVDEAKYLAIESFRKEYERRGRDETQLKLTLFGETIYVSLIVIFFTLYLSLFRKDYFEKLRSIAMPYTLIIIFTLLTALMVRNTFAHVFMLPYAMLAIFIRIFMDSRTAFITHLVMVLLCASMLQHTFDFVIVEATAGMVAIFSLRELQYRSQLFKTALLVTISSMLMHFAYDLMTVSDIERIDMSNYNYLVINGILLLFAYPLLYLLEKTFGFVTDITLIELNNTNNPLLQRMSELTPGTFQHSIQVGNLAAEIAKKIGAKSQLVRTGAMYHDIGKMTNPVYFTENQSSINPHDGMSQIDSARIIISHVTEGLKLAEKFNLPTVIREFISTHHGQGKTKYFYVNYKNEHPDDPVDDLLFTYPGPNPFTREQAILMMADSVEAASRSLPDYTEQNIRDLVNRIIDGLLADGFFRDCPITFRDISYAKTVLIEKLKTIYHARVSYPELKQKE
ncbi:MAG: HDIG domain-containing protein [Prevotella sp.]|nr:HDIG domain-containing protein [Prevotella sp.]MDD6737589.1 HDIG domain-containing protein [Prevotella sp.]MDY6091812.1 HDIG domain-containing protein [Prevotella sp.]